MAKSWFAIAAMVLLLVGCSANNAEQTYPVSVEDAYGALTRLDLEKDKDPALPGGRVETDLVALQSVTWRFMIGDLETGRITATLAPKGDSETVVLFDVDTSRAPSTGAIGDQTNSLIKPWRAAYIAEKLSATLENRDYDRERVNALARTWGYGGVGQTLDVLANRGDMQAQALNTEAQMKALQRGEKVDMGLGAYEKAFEQEAMRNAPSQAKPSYAEQQARKWEQQNP